MICFLYNEVYSDRLLHVLMIGPGYASMFSLRNMVSLTPECDLMTVYLKCRSVLSIDDAVS